MTRYLLGATAALALAVTSWAQSAPGNIRAVRVGGTVQASVGAQSVRVTEGMLLQQNMLVTTGANGSVVLLFSNGSSIALRPDSRLMVSSYLQDPFKGRIPSRSEPSVSKTDLMLQDGAMVYNVRRLDSKSEYTLRTPLGAAGIRGTAGDLATSTAGQRNTTSTTLQSGAIGFIPNLPGSEERSIPAGNTYNASGDIDPNGNVTNFTESLTPADVDKLKEIEEEAGTINGLLAGNPPPTPTGEPPPAQPGQEGEEGLPPEEPTVPITPPGTLNPGGFTSPS